MFVVVYQQLIDRMVPMQYCSEYLPVGKNTGESYWLYLQKNSAGHG